MNKEVRMKTPIKSAVAKQELVRINTILSEPHLLVGGLAVQSYFPARDSQDIDLVCSNAIVNIILESLYPNNDWRYIDKNEDECRPSFVINHRIEPKGDIIFGPKIIEREPYGYINWGSLIATAKPFSYRNEELPNILIPSPTALAFTKIISFIWRFKTSETNKAVQDLTDFVNLTNHEDFSINEFLDIVRKSDAHGQIQTGFIQQAREQINVLSRSCVFKVAEILGISSLLLTQESEFDHFPFFLKQHFLHRKESLEKWVSNPHNNQISTTELYQFLLEIYPSSSVHTVQIIDAVPKRWEEIVSENASLNYGTETLKIITRRFNSGDEIKFCRVFIVDENLEREINNNLNGNHNELDKFFDAMAKIKFYENKIHDLIKKNRKSKKETAPYSSDFSNHVVFLSAIEEDENLLSLFKKLGDIVVVNNGQMACTETPASSNMNYHSNVSATSYSQIHINNDTIKSSIAANASKDINEFFRLLKTKTRKCQYNLQDFIKKYAKRGDKKQ